MALFRSIAEGRNGRDGVDTGCRLGLGRGDHLDRPLPSYLSCIQTQPASSLAPSPLFGAWSQHQQEGSTTRHHLRKSARTARRLSTDCQLTEWNLLLRSNPRPRHAQPGNHHMMQPSMAEKLKLLERTAAAR